MMRIYWYCFWFSVETGPLKKQCSLIPECTASKLFKAIWLVENKGANWSSANLGKWLYILLLIAFQLFDLKQNWRCNLDHSMGFVASVATHTSLQVGIQHVHNGMCDGLFSNRLPVLSRLRSLLPVLQGTVLGFQRSLETIWAFRGNEMRKYIGRSTYWLNVM
jgi:hypothetical protein